MKYFIFFLLVHLLLIDSAGAQGQFAGTRSKALIGKKYNNDRVLPGLADYEYRDASLATGENEPEQFTVAVFQKGPTYIVLFGVNEDTTSDEYTILDVLVIKQVKKRSEEHTSELQSQSNLV